MFNFAILKMKSPSVGDNLCQSFLSVFLFVCFSVLHLIFVYLSVSHLYIVFIATLKMKSPSTGDNLCQSFLSVFLNLHLFSFDICATIFFWSGHPVSLSIFARLMFKQY